jgi:hypothetical protein
MMVEERANPDLLELSRRPFEAGGRTDVDGLMGFYGPDVVLAVPEVQQRAAWVSTWRGSSITRITVYIDAGEARAQGEQLAAERCAAGLEG